LLGKIFLASALKAESRKLEAAQILSLLKVVPAAVLLARPQKYVYVELTEHRVPDVCISETFGATLFSQRPLRVPCGVCCRCARFGFLRQGMFGQRLVIVARE